MFPHVSHSVSPLLNILHFHRTLVKTKTNIDELLLTIPHTLEDVTRFPINVLFLFQDLFQGTTLHLVVMAPQLSLVYDSFSVFACLHDLDSLEEYWPHIL